ncbi:unnamed protein product [Vitrella brassicaformis CCMP3155]|uniref:GH16 domain-containing protein n=1 Tax=Vitrella brassicaformis (strain CCMP3155) TaxID=1169540 RepID=A0A0G4FVP0_VITBC|nr:unnamed protein product [Vitrella brassicaformis CCMP3155]|eukprot:CEM19222.1 unnamed protein product [Vitrella brassicaformis CCMP3155]
MQQAQSHLREAVCALTFISALIFIYLRGPSGLFPATKSERHGRPTLFERRLQREDDDPERFFFAQPIVTDIQSISLADAPDLSEGFIIAIDRPPPPAEADAWIIIPLNLSKDGRSQDSGLVAQQGGGYPNSRQFPLAVPRGIFSPARDTLDRQGRPRRPVWWWVPNATVPDSPPFWLPSRPRPAVRLPPHFKFALYDGFDGGSLDFDTFMYRQPHQLCGRNSFCDPSYVSVERGKLVIRLRYLEKPFAYKKAKEVTLPSGRRYRINETCYAWFSGGGVVTRRRYQYGYFETRVKMTKTPGWHEAFWTSYSDGGNNLHPMSYEPRSEFDVFEHFGSFGRSEFYYGVYRWSGGGPRMGRDDSEYQPLTLERLTGSRWQFGKQLDVDRPDEGKTTTVDADRSGPSSEQDEDTAGGRGLSLVNNYHIFSLWFDRERAAWYLDGNLIHEVRAKTGPSAPDGPYEKIPKNLFHVWLSTITNYRTEGDPISPPDCYYGGSDGKVVSGEGDVFFDYLLIYTID